MSLFQTETFLSHAGKTLHWKIDCDALTKHDIACLTQLTCAVLALRGVSRFYAIGIPRGGVRLAKALNRGTGYHSSERTRVIIDDVLTTGTSMQAELAKYPGALGVVIFARGPLPQNVFALFQLHHLLCEQ